MPPPSLLRLTGLFLRISSFTFGGGNPTMAALYRELVETRGWLSAEKYGLAYALARITPGTNVLAFSAGVAWELLGWKGAVAAMLASTIPVAVLAVLLTAGYDAVRAYPRAMAAVGGTLAAAVGMMATGAWQLLATHLRSKNAARIIRAIVFSGGALVLARVFGFNPITVLALAAAAGALWEAPPKA